MSASSSCEAGSKTTKFSANTMTHATQAAAVKHSAGSRHSDKALYREILGLGLHLRRQCGEKLSAIGSTRPAAVRSRADLWGRLVRHAHSARAA